MEKRAEYLSIHLKFFHFRRGRAVREIDMDPIRFDRRYANADDLIIGRPGQGLLIGLPSNPVIDFDIPRRQRSNTLAQQTASRGCASILSS